MRITPFLFLVLAVALPASALVNPSLQPLDLYERHRAVIGAKLFEKTDQSVTFEVTHVLKGEFAPKRITLTADGEGVADAMLFLPDDQVIVAYIGPAGRGQQNKVLFYTGSGLWHEAMLTAEPSKWAWKTVLEGQGDQSLFGTFNGRDDRLLEMMIDMQHGRAFFPALPFVQFEQDRVLHKFEAPARGVALYDVDGDSRLDVYACSEAGDRLLLQTRSMQFSDATQQRKLDRLKSRSVSFADVDGDGAAELLADGAILAMKGEAFEKTSLLPDTTGVLVSAFVELNGDGWTDVLMATSRGLEAYLNPGRRDEPFQLATGPLGLDKQASGAGKAGYFAAGDYNADGRTDLYYGVDAGLVLLQTDDETFAPMTQDLELELNTEAAGQTGAGVFAPLWEATALSLLVPVDAGYALLVIEDDELKNVAPLGNETTETAESQLFTLAEDLNADGWVDYYTGSRAADSANTFHMNRGYGSFMRPEKYNNTIFPGPAHRRGALGAAAGDVNGDGALDLLLAGADGSLTLMINDVLSLRQPKPHPTYHEKKLQETALLTVDVAGSRGVVGAVVTVKSQDGRVVGLRQIANNILTGCRGPDSAVFALREPGAYVIQTRYADGTHSEASVEVPPARHTRITVQRQ